MGRYAPTLAEGARGRGRRPMLNRFPAVGGAGLPRRGTPPSFCHRQARSEDGAGKDARPKILVLRAEPSIGEIAEALVAEAPLLNRTGIAEVIAGEVLPGCDAAPAQARRG